MSGQILCSPKSNKVHEDQIMNSSWIQKLNTIYWWPWKVKFCALQEVTRFMRIKYELISDLKALYDADLTLLTPAERKRIFFLPLE